MGGKFLNVKDILTEKCLCGVCKGYLSIPPIVYTIKLELFVCGRCYEAEFYKSDIIIRQKEYEMAASKYLFPCSNEYCDIKVKFGEDAKFHEQICQFAEIKCPISNFFRGYLKPKEVPCFFRCEEESEMIQHIKLNHTDYILPAPQMIRSSDVLMDSATRRMHIIIFLDEFQYRMAVLTRDKDSKRMKLRCRTIVDEPQYCVVGINPSLNDTIQCISCVPLSRPRYEEELHDEVYKIKISHFNTCRTFRFDIEDVEYMGRREEFLMDAIQSLKYIGDHFD